MQATESITATPFAELIDDAQRLNQPFNLAIIPTNNNPYIYHFFKAENLACWFKATNQNSIGRPSYKNPNNRDEIQTILIYRYDSSRPSSNFPFVLEENIDRNFFQQNFISVYQSPLDAPIITGWKNRISIFLKHWVNMIILQASRLLRRRPS